MQPAGGAADVPARWLRRTREFPGARREALRPAAEEHPAAPAVTDPGGPGAYARYADVTGVLEGVSGDGLRAEYDELRRGCGGSVPRAAFADWVQRRYSALDLPALLPAVPASSGAAGEPTVGFDEFAAAAYHIAAI
eukprot:TRINITY_DN15232_c0_g1_i1.p3 TRINITY_DN15232_c0_g1~~TRINITY_DN15232_c0_g1_i1.p3  ORF type:complete len:137 (+),score=39.13 TRINITY_DN15232_c0_g1_i1:74-484(+)